MPLGGYFGRALVVDAVEGPLLAPLWALLASDRFQAAVTGLGGCSAREMGRRRR